MAEKRWAMSMVICFAFRDTPDYWVMFPGGTMQKLPHQRSAAWDAVHALQWISAAFLRPQLHTSLPSTALQAYAITVQEAFSKHPHLFSAWTDNRAYGPENNHILGSNPFASHRSNDNG
jgi:hypothetical protein